jgi:predicted transcriptional regulator of viral defense system
MNSLSHINYRAKALEIVRIRGIARASDFIRAKIPVVYLMRLVKSGDIVRLDRGLYQEPRSVATDRFHAFAEAARRTPLGVICLISALDYHGLTTQVSGAVWMTIPQGSRVPNSNSFRIEVVRASGKVLSENIEIVIIEGVDVPIFGVAKTIADCFKHRNKVGEDIAIEALKNALSQRLTTPAELRSVAETNKITSIMGPYLKALQ